MENSQEANIEELAEIREEISFWQKVQSTALTVVAIMLSIGQWNDTKEVVITSYEGIKAIWTNEVEYARLSKISIGHTLEYAESELGVAQAIKQSKLNQDVTFRYYKDNKYLLSLAVKNERIVGLSLVSLIKDFQASLPYHNGEINDLSLVQLFEQSGPYFTDSGNIDYYLESQELGRNAMFYSLLIGIVDYGDIPQLTISSLKSLNNALNQGKESLESELSAVRMQRPNAYAVTELSPAVMAESYLTRFEYNAYFAKG
ncbi:hypothetical protein BIT28_06385 [Photobacterium proteolyticum]|uniref:Uncharacterized protein n=1 Tax=Photobacterium proteolyticum TaxID=1903952 RepID=A0A1Q9GEJ4_9GAMM|nr:ETEC_3214 domain-containing protein [Photobacterium proteolyticum]OLQ72812.1 hypothetical protein BIT28_06385 [Photobacterium proteolyticum]